MQKNDSEIKWTLPFESVTKEQVFDEKIVIPFERKVVVLHLSEFGDGDIDFEEFLRIDYSNIIGELLTFPVLMNRIGLLRAEMESIAKTKKFETDVYEAQLKAHYRKKLLTRDGKDQVKKATQGEVEEAVLMDKGYQVVMRNLITTEKGFSQIDAMFWSAKDKSHKLDKIAEKLHPKEFENEILEGSCNGIMIKVKANGKWK